MKATELRIGNWVKHNSEWSYRQKDNDLKEFYFQFNEMDWYAIMESTMYLDNIHPIHLTEEILLKAGLKKYNEDIYLSPYPYAKYDEVFDAMYYSFKYSQFVINSNNYDGFETDIKYLHQLQNLYFALTGEELNIQL